MRVGFAVVGLVLLAGCTGSGSYEKGSAFEAHRFTRELAEDWEDDVVLLGLSGFEFAEAEATEFRIDDSMVDSFDTNLGDGLAPIWGVAYYSPSAGKVKAYLVVDGDVDREEEINVKGDISDDEADEYRSAARDWSADSTDAAQALANEADFSPLAGNLTRMVYSLDLDRAEWEVFGGTRTKTFYAEVSARSGELHDLEVTDEVDLPIDEVPRVPPPPIHDEQAVQVSVDFLAPLGFTPCQAPTSSCFEYPFEAPTPFDMHAALTWTNAANDFDLYLFQGDEVVDVSGQASPGTEESLEETYAPGSYRLVVAAYASVEDTFTVDAQFS